MAEYDEDSKDDRSADRSADRSTDRDADRSQVLRDRMLTATADATVAAQRLASLAESRGLSADDLKGTGDVIYDVITDQILLAERVISHQHRVLERVVERLMRHDEPQDPLRLAGAKGSKPHVDFVVRNRSLRSGTVTAPKNIVLKGADGCPQTTVLTDFSLVCGKPRLEPGDRTHARLTLTLPGPPDTRYHGRLELSLRLPDDTQIDVFARDLEVWVEKPSGK